MNCHLKKNKITEARIWREEKRGEEREKERGDREKEKCELHMCSNLQKEAPGLPCCSNCLDFLIVLAMVKAHQHISYLIT